MLFTFWPESLVAKDKISRFLDLAEFPQNLAKVKCYVSESVKVSELSKERQFENISKKADGISWSEFVA